MDKKSALILILILSALMLIPLASASFKCYTKVEYENQIIQINPAQEKIDQVGIIDYFEPQPSDSKFQYVKVYFTAQDLRDNEPVNFSVVCAGDNVTFSFEREITPQYKDLNTDVVDRGIWIGDNAAFIVFVVIGIVIFAFIAVAVYKGVKE